jgi:hypothetical protein
LFACSEKPYREEFFEIFSVRLVLDNKWPIFSDPARSNQKSKRCEAGQPSAKSSTLNLIPDQVPLR